MAGAPRLSAPAAELCPQLGFHPRTPRTGSDPQPLQTAHISYPDPALNWDPPRARRLFICSSSGFRDEKAPALTRDLLKCWNNAEVLGVLLCINISGREGFWLINIWTIRISPQAPRLVRSLFITEREAAIIKPMTCLGENDVYWVLITI